VDSNAGGNGSNNLLEAAMRLPDAILSKQAELAEEEWESIMGSISAAIRELNEYRMQEGKTMEEDIRTRIGNILEKLSGITALEEGRIRLVRERIRSSLDELLQEDATDPGRFEQEMIFYLEKYDITEEQVRLRSHCEFFLECMDSRDPIGKKLGFITQEMGREINTLGSKAYDPGIQRLVVEMKDELEKIKEQILNIL
jgi:uncharacterized protein (TIGR00255 family)